MTQPTPIRHAPIAGWLLLVMSLGLPQPGWAPEPAIEDQEAAFIGDTIRFTVIVAGQPVGERLVWHESPDVWRHVAEGPPSGFRRISSMTLDSAGLPVRLEISGRKNPVDVWQEQFELNPAGATWSTPVDRGQSPLYGPAYYAAIHPAHDVGVLVRALLRQPAGTLRLLPQGEARLEPLGAREVRVSGRQRVVHHYAVRGLDFRPIYVWLDADGGTFADEWSILAGWEAAFGELRAATAGAIADDMRRMAHELIPPAREQPLVIRGARLFDAQTGSVASGTTILIEGNRIAAVGPDVTIAAPADAEVIEAAGRAVLPGLWDMHAHQDPGRYFDWTVPIHVAAGVTTTRDMGSNPEMLIRLRERIEAGDALGPRILMAGFIDGVGGNRTGVQVESVTEARAAVDRYAELGFVQIKIYNRLPADLVTAVVERAKHHGLRVSGHIPWEMTAWDAVKSGFDEIQHMTALLEGMVLDPTADLSDREIAEALAKLTPDSELVREFIGMLVSRGVAVDPNLAFFHSTQLRQKPPGACSFAADP